MRSIVSLSAVTGGVLAAAALATASPAAAEPNPTLPDCKSAEGGTYTGTGITQCQSPGNVQISATAPQAPAYLYPWNDEYYGPALIIGGGGWGPHGGGGHGR